MPGKCSSFGHVWKPLQEPETDIDAALIKAMQSSEEQDEGKTVGYLGMGRNAYRYDIYDDTEISSFDYYN